jgi:hypothetical protein
MELAFTSLVRGLLALTLAAQGVDHARAAQYFKEATALCERDAGRLWGVSLCGPIVLADPISKTVVTSEPEPSAPRPAALGFANAAVEWGGTRWTAIVWPLIPADPSLRARLLLHELFHRVQPRLGLMTRDGVNVHLDTAAGRYWLQLEWRALERALGAAEEATRREAALDALTFRASRHRLFAGSLEEERLEEIREGLAQYTGTVLAAASAAEARADAARQLQGAPNSSSLVRTFAYPSGAAYGLLLDEWQPGWPRRVTAADNLGTILLQALGGLVPSEAGPERESRYGGPELLRLERSREDAHEARLTDLRRRFVEGPVLVLPNAPGSFVTDGVTPIPDVGTVYPRVRVTAEWGTLEADLALRSGDRRRLVVPAPASPTGPVLQGDGWTLALAPGWVLQPGQRSGDYEVVRR